MRADGRGEALAVLRCRFPDGRLVDFPVAPGLDEVDRTRWVEGWKAGASVCLTCRDAAARDAMVVLEEPAADRVSAADEPRGGRAAEVDGQYANAPGLRADRLAVLWIQRLLVARGGLAVPGRA